MTFLSFCSSNPSIAARWNFQTVADDPIEAADEREAFAAFEAIEADLSAARRAGRNARWAGYVGYELNRSIERLPAARPVAHGTPTLTFWRIEGTCDVDPEALDERPASLTSRSMSRDDYLSAARRAIEYIAAGDGCQVNLAHSLCVTTFLSPFWASLTLQRQAPAPYGALIETSDFAIVSNSPELFFRIEPLAGGRRRITTRPIKGTRPRGPGMREELERSEKDRAELAMIVDLERNDLGRVCEIGSVRVIEPRVIEEHPTVYHGVATIEGMLRPDVTLADVFRAMFPCGSITGCPKVRAMEIIDELEGAPRGPYCGAIGYVDSDGSAEFSVAIRTMTMRDGIARVSVGGGIVADSDPADEYRETIDKARAMLSALGVPREQIDALRAE